MRGGCARSTALAGGVVGVGAPLPAEVPWPMHSAPAFLALLLLLPGLAAALPECTEAILRIELSPEPREPPEVCLSAGLDTSFRFNTRLLPNGVVVEPAGRPLEWAASPRGLTFYTSDELTPGERFTLKLLLQGPQEPMAVAFALVVHPARATRQVQLLLGDRPPSDYRQEAREATARAERCEVDKAHMEVACKAPAGLLGMLGAAPIEAGEFGALNLLTQVKERPRRALALRKLTAYRVGTQVVLDVRLRNPTSLPWAPVGALLVDAQGRELAVLPLPRTVSIQPGEKRGRVLVGALLPLEAPKGPYTLKLWEAGGRTVTLGNISFP
jgi:uncharacterized protein (TIGR02268 family)